MFPQKSRVFSQEVLTKTEILKQEIVLWKSLRKPGFSNGNFKKGP